ATGPWDSPGRPGDVCLESGHAPPRGRAGGTSRAAVQESRVERLAAGLGFASGRPLDPGRGILTHILAAQTGSGSGRDAPGLPRGESRAPRHRRQSAFLDAPGLPRGASRLSLQQGPSPPLGCPGLAPGRFTLASTPLQDAPIAIILIAATQ